MVQDQVDEFRALIHSLVFYGIECIQESCQVLPSVEHSVKRKTKCVKLRLKTNFHKHQELTGLESQYFLLHIKAA